ncbi:oxidoreductase [Dactylosporangium fulvum]
MRASVLADLLARPVDRTTHPRAALRLRGATVVGVLDIAHTDVAVPVELHDCTLADPVDVSGARLAGLHLVRCRLPGLQARLVDVRGDVLCTESTIGGPVDLRDARIGGDLDLDRAQLRNPAGNALAAARLSVGGSLRATELRTAGELWLGGAQVGGNVLLDGAVLDNPAGRVVGGDRLRVGGNVRAGAGFTADGDVMLIHVDVGGQLWFVDATLRSPDGFALNLGGSTAGSVWLGFREPPVGRVRLSGLRVDTLFDDPRVWPAELDLVGCTYRLVMSRAFESGPQPRGPSGLAAVGVRSRLDWLRRSPDGYAPQPYEQLAEVYRRNGQDVEARRVLLEKHRRRRATLHWPGRFAGYLLDGLVGYGYRTWLAGLWLLGCWAIGTAAFTRWPAPARNPAEAPERNPALYALDLLLPIINLGHDTAWKPTGTAQYIAAGLVVMGWVLTTAAVAGLTRLINR